MDKNSSDKEVLDAFFEGAKQETPRSGGCLRPIIWVPALLLLLFWANKHFRGEQDDSSSDQSDGTPALRVNPITAKRLGIAPVAKVAPLGVGSPSRSTSTAASAVGQPEHEHQHFEAEGALVTDHGIPLFQETQTAGGISPSQRAQIVARRLNDKAMGKGLDPTKIQARLINDVAAVCFVEPSGGAFNLATVDPQTATQFGYPANSARLTFWWRDVLRDHACVIAGNPPIYTTPYSSALQNVYSLCQKQEKGIPSHEGFEKAISNLSRADHDDLQGLYIKVPSNYHPQKN